MLIDQLTDDNSNIDRVHGLFNELIFLYIASSIRDLSLDHLVLKQVTGLFTARFLQARHTPSKGMGPPCVWHRAMSVTEFNSFHIRRFRKI